MRNGRGFVARMMGTPGAAGRGRAPGGRRRVATVIGLAVMLAATFVPGPARAGHTGVFELEGDMVDSPSGAPWDWTTFFDAAGNRITPLPADFLDSGFDSDYAFPDMSTFTGGSKDILDVSGWSCTDSNNLGGKFDIVNAYSTIYTVPAGANAGDQLLFFGIERAATEGDGAMGFWFLHDGRVDCEKLDKGKAPAFSGNHMDGDIFVAAGFSNGGTEASVTAYKWVGGATGFLDIDNPFVSGPLCAADKHDACGIVNTAEIPTDAGKPWPSPDKNGGALDVNAFYEGFVRVPAADTTGCFATFVANTRSSTSPTATIMDFSRGSFPTCQPSTTMTGLATPTTASPEVVVGGASNPDTVTYSFGEKNDGNVALTNVYVVTDNAACNSTLTPASVATLAKNATATFTCTVSASATAAVQTVRAVGHGTSALGDVTVCGADALPFPAAATAVCDPDEQDRARSVTIIPGTNLAVSRSPAVAKAGDTITYTVTEQNDGTAPTGFDSALDLEDVAVVASAGAGASATEVTACNTGLAAAPVKTGGDTDTKLEKGETWTYMCTVTAPSGTFTLDFTGSGTVLKGTARARVVTYSTPTCTNVAGATGVPGLFCDADERKSATVTVIAPSTQLDITASAVITYTFVEKNDGDAALTPPNPASRVSIITFGTGQLCDNTALAYVSGDASDDMVLSPGEAWTFTCKGNLAGPTDTNGAADSSSSTLTGFGHGCDVTGSDITAAAATALCTGTNKLVDNDERDRVKVTIDYFPRGLN